MARITAVQDRGHVASEMVAGALHMPLAQMNPNIILIAIETAKEQADGYLNNPFLDADGTEQDIPDSVLLGVIAMAAAIYARPVPGIAKEKTDHVTIEYDYEKAIQNVQRMYWQTYKKYRIVGGSLDADGINTARRDYTGDE